MPNYRRFRVAGATYFFTVTLAQQGSDLLVRRIDDLRAAYRRTYADHPFVTEAIVVLPDHLHAIWTLPDGDADFSERWRKIKARFTRATGETHPASHSKRQKREAGLWQRRFWEHMIRSQDDFDRHFRLCLLNPVQHGLVDRPEAWPYSSLHRDLRAGRPLPLVAEGGQIAHPTTRHTL